MALEAVLGDLVPRLRQRDELHRGDEFAETEVAQALGVRDGPDLLEVGAGEPGHAEELDGVGARDAAVAI